jgi:hypothetical protein
MLHTRALLLALASCLAAPAAAAERWMLMARHGECAEIGTLERRVPNLGNVASPTAFVERMRRDGLQVIAEPLADTGGKAVQVKVPEKNLSLVFVMQELCSRKQ